MTFSTTVPLSTERPSYSVNRFQSNWTKANADYSINHIPWTATAENGRHTKVQFDTNNASVAQALLRSEIYTAVTNPTTTDPLPAFRNLDGSGFLVPVGARIRFNRVNANTNPVPLTGDSLNTTLVTYTLAGTFYEITMTGALTDTNYLVMVQCPSPVQVVIVNTTTFRLITAATVADHIAVIVYGQVAAGF